MLLRLHAIFCLQVSWARGRDWHILTSGRHVYTADERFQVQQRSPTNQTYAGPSNRSTQSYSSTSEWFLQIQFVQSRDSGFYICQVRLSAQTMIVFLCFVRYSSDNCFTFNLHAISFLECISWFDGTWCVGWRPDPTLCSTTPPFRQ